MSIKTRKIKNGKNCFYISVNGRNYTLKPGNRSDSIDLLDTYKDNIGDYVVVDNEKYYIYLNDKKEIKSVDKEKNSNGKIEVLVFNGVKFENKLIKPVLKEFQNLVGGPIESPYFASNIDKEGIYWTINEEGTHTSPTTLLIVDKMRNVVGQVNGVIVFSRLDGNGKSIGLSETDIKYIKKQFKLTLKRDKVTGNLLYSIVTGVYI